MVMMMRTRTKQSLMIKTSTIGLQINTQQVLMLQVGSNSLILSTCTCWNFIVNIAPYIRYSAVCTAYIWTRDLYLGSGKGRPSDNGH